MRNLDKIFKIIAFLVLLLLSVTSKAQVPLYQLEYAPDSNYVIGADNVGEPIWVLKSSIASIDSIYLQGDSLIVLRDGNGQVYKNRIHIGFTYPEDVPNPKKYDIFIKDNEVSYWYDGSAWQFFDQDTNASNEGQLSLHNISTNIAAIRSNTNYSDAKKFVGRHGVTVNTNEIDSLNIGIDTSLIATTYDLTLKQNLLNGVSPRIPYFTSATTLGTNANFWWDNTYTELVIKDRLFGSFATGQLYVGLNSGYNATSAIHSNFLSDGAGYAATNAAYSNFFGKDAGFQAVSTPYSNFLGRESGYQATNATHSNFMGYRSGRVATNASYSFFVGDSTGMSATNAKHSNFFGYRAGYGATNAKYSFFAGDSTGMSATGAEYSNFIGLRAGYGASNAYWSNFFGRDAGSGATQAFYSNFIGYKAGSGASLSYGANFMGNLAGYLAVTAEYSNFIGNSAGWSSTNSANSNFIGKNAGYAADNSGNSNFIGEDSGGSNAYHSNFLGYRAGGGASAEYSNFMGHSVGYGQHDAAYSNLFGYRVGEIGVGKTLGLNNIIIGTNITLPDLAENSMSLGNVLYGTGFKYDPTDADSTQYISTLGKIGILVTNPTQQLHVNGNLRVEDAIYDSNNEPGTSGQILSTTVTGTDWIDAPDGEPQYLNPYVLSGDTVGFYLTVAVDTVLFVPTADTSGITIDSTIIIGGWGIDATESPLNTWNLIIDSSQVATQFDLIDLDQALTIDSTNRVFTIGITNGNTVKFKDTGGIDSTSVVNSYGTIINESPANQWNVKVDSSKFATVYDLSQVSVLDSTTVVNSYGTIITESPSNQFNIKVDSSKFATVYDLTQVVASSSKVTDILGSDFTTSTTSLQSTALAYTFPSTGTYEVKVYGSYTVSNTANGINVGFIDSGGLVASYITGKHIAFTNNTNSSTTETRRPISAIGTTLSTASAFAASTQYVVMSEALITVSTAGTITFGFASGSGSYSATLQAGSSLIVEKLN